MQAAQALGEELGRRGIGLVYGGGSSGLMGKVSETVNLTCWLGVWSTHAVQLSIGGSLRQPTTEPRLQFR